MKKLDFLKSFQNLKEEVQESKKLQFKILSILENQTLFQGQKCNPDEERISVKEACQILGLSEVSVWKLRKDGTLPYTQHKRTIRFKKTDIYNYLNQAK